MNIDNDINIKFPKISDLLFEYRYVIAALLFLGVIIFALNGSSFEMWLHIMLGNGFEESALIGSARAIRSDEFAVNLPLLLSQWKNGFPYFNDALRGTATDMYMVYGQPVWDIAVLFRPFHWGYLILGAERGLSFFWYGRLIALFMVSFEFGRVITKDNRGLSLCLALLVAGSPVVQWWFAVNYLAELLISGMLAVVLIDFFMKKDSLKIRIICAAGLAICAGSYCVSLYPAWQIPLGFVFAGLAIWNIIENIGKRKWHKSDVVIISIALIFTVAMLLRILIKSWDAIQAVLNCVYPGARLERGGSEKYSYFRYLIGTILPFYENGLPTNVCEDAMTFDFFPLCYILPLLLIFKEKKKDKFTIIMLAVAVFLNIWLLFKMPVWYAKVTLMSNVTPRRCAMVIGFLNLFLFFRALSFKERKWPVLPVVLLIALCVASAVLMNRFIMADYLTSGKMAFTLISLVLCILVAALHNNKNIENIMLICLLVGGISIFAVNPVEKGLDVLYEDGMLNKIEKIDNNDKGLWLVADIGFPVNNYPVMAGVKTLNSIATYPDLEGWRKIDSDGQSEDVYNRYAEIIINLKNNGESEFELKSPGVFNIYFNIKDLEKYNVKYIFANEDLEKFTNDEILFNRIWDYKSSWKIYKVEYK